MTDNKSAVAENVRVTIEGESIPDEYGFLVVNVGPAPITVDPSARNVTVEYLDDPTAGRQVTPTEPVMDGPSFGDYWPSDDELKARAEKAERELAALREHERGAAEALIEAELKLDEADETIAAVRALADELVKQAASGAKINVGRRLLDILEQGDK